MPNFRYTAKNPTGQTVSGTLFAKDQAEVIGELRRKNLVVLKIKKAGEGDRRPAAAGGAAPRGSFFTLSLKGGRARPGAKKDELVLFARQLATMISAGVPLLESLEILKEQAESAGFKVVLDDVIAEIRGGKDLSQCLEKYPRVFSNVFVSMIRAGEASGQLDEILQRLADYMEATAKLKRDIKAAMTYPVISLVLVLGITAFLMIGIVPKFKEVFDSLEITLPRLTSIVMNTSLWCSDNWHILAGAITGLVMALGAYKRTRPGRRLFDKLKLSVPIFGPLFRKVALSRFSRTFATLIKSGVPILGALEIVADTSGNVMISDVVSAARENVRQGDTLSEPLSKSTVFPPMVTRMIGIGEKSGSLETLLEKISQFYDEQVAAEVKSLTSLIEPLLIGVMGFLVGGIVLAVFLPIFELQKKLASR
jgi:type IV pilus assembly protein PilC